MSVGQCFLAKIVIGVETLKTRKSEAASDYPLREDVWE
jgi:hypothetical protein